MVTINMSKSEAIKLKEFHPDVFTKLMTYMFYAHATNTAIHSHHIYLINLCQKHSQNSIKKSEESMMIESERKEYENLNIMWNEFQMRLHIFDQDIVKNWLKLTNIFNKLFNDEYASYIMEEGKKK